MKSILLDFCNMDIRKVSGIFANYTCVDHKNILGHWLNLAAFLTADTCFLPIGFVAECAVLQSALDVKRSFFDVSIFRIAGRELNISAFLSKRRAEYEYKRSDYPDLYSSSTDEFLSRYAHYLVSRRGKTGEGIAHKWQERADQAPIWSMILKTTLTKAVDKIKNRPSVLIGRGHAVLWHDIIAQKGVSVEGGTHIRDLLNRDLLLSYIDEYDLGTLRNLPFGWRDILDDKNSIYLNVDLLRKVVGEVLFGIICTLPADQLIDLKDDFGVFSFIEIFDKVASELSGDSTVLRKVASQARASLGDEISKLGTKYGQFLGPSSAQTKLTDEDIRLLKQIISRIGQNIEAQHTGATQMTGHSVAMQNASFASDQKPKKSIALFAALDLETRIISKDLELSPNSDNSWFKASDDLDIHLYSSMGMGRVRAAVATMQFLQTVRPDLIIVVGIAGGFGKEGAEQGQIIVPENVIDLSIRKIYEVEGTEFRPQPFNLDGRLRSKLMSPQFDKNAWIAKAADDLDWPNGKRPSFTFDRDITSTDEVVSATRHIDDILNAYPRLIAVEMEAGGVCAACQKLTVPVCVLRGISDKADPAKKDDAWRSLSMKTIVHLLKNFDLKSIF